MADRYWVGGSAIWDTTAGTKWATTSGGAGGAAVPTGSDDVFINAASGTVTVTRTGTTACRSLNCTGFTGTLAGTGGLQLSSNLTFSAGMTLTYTGALTFSSGSSVITTAGKQVRSSISLSTSSTVVSLADALSSISTISVSGGTFNTNNYALTAVSFSATVAGTRVITFGSSVITLTGSAGLSLLSTSLTLNAGTSLINLTAVNPTLDPSLLTLYDVSFTSTSNSAISLLLIGTVRNLSFAGRSSNITTISIGRDFTVTGTLTISAGTNATVRTFVRSDIIGTTRTVTCAAVAALTDIDFRDITIAGAAAPVSGTRLGDCKGNGGITFPAPKTVYTVSTGSGLLSSTIWASTPEGVASNDNFPLAQDTAIVQAATPGTGTTLTISLAYNIGTLDTSQRTVNTLSLSMSASIFVYGDILLGTAVTPAGTGTLTFSGRGSQTIRSAGRTFSQGISVTSPGGTVQLLDALTTNRSELSSINVTAGTLNDGGYNITSTNTASGGFQSSSNSDRALVINGTWTFAGQGNVFSMSGVVLPTVSGSGTISLTAAGSKTFVGGGIKTWPTINQGGTGALTISGSNKFKNITNTVLADVLFTGGTTQEFDAFNLNGLNAANRLKMGSTTTATVFFRKSTPWNLGADSIPTVGVSGINFVGTSPNFLEINYINAQVIASGNYNFFAFF